MARPVTGEEKMIDRIAKILNQGESLPEGSPERELFMERAFALSQAHSIDLAIARAHTQNKEKVEEPEERQYVIGQRGRRSQSAKWSHFVDLVFALGEAYDMSGVLARDRSWVALMGYPSDHEMVERMYTMLSTQMVVDADTALKRGDNKAERLVPVTKKEPIDYWDREWGGWDVKNQRWYVDEGQVLDEDGEYWSEYAHRYVKPYYPPEFKDVQQYDPETGKPLYEKKLVSTTDGRIWRANFYKAFVQRVKERMRQARETAQKDAGIDVVDASSEKGLVLLNKAEEIQDRYEKTMMVRVSKRSKSYGGAQLSEHDLQAQRAGRESAERATYGDERVVD